jgi:hypothetical protein
LFGQEPGRRIRLRARAYGPAQSPFIRSHVPAVPGCVRRTTHGVQAMRSPPERRWVSWPQAPRSPMQARPRCPAIAGTTPISAGRRVSGTFARKSPHVGPGDSCARSVAARARSPGFVARMPDVGRKCPLIGPYRPAFPPRPPTDYGQKLTPWCSSRFRWRPAGMQVAAAW